MSIAHSLHVKIQKILRNYWLPSNLHNYKNEKVSSNCHRLHLISQIQIFIYDIDSQYDEGAKDVNNIWAPDIISYDIK